MSPNTEIGILLDVPIRVVKRRPLPLVIEVDLALESTSREFRKLFRIKPSSIVKELVICGTNPKDWLMKKPGCIRQLPQTVPFWERYEPHLLIMLHHAHQSWKAKLKDCAAILREPGSNAYKEQIREKVVRLNLAWEFVEKQFKKKGITI